MKMTRKTEFSPIVYHIALMLEKFASAEQRNVIYSFVRGYLRDEIEADQRARGIEAI